ncbi:MAG: hypothetical protein MI757_11715, partial [Pirellulales bacterium]|nr:hypothetical protein [Pirellulales bacterium]
MLALTLLRPERVREIQRAEEPVIAVLTDATGSMETRDIANGTNVLRRADWLRSRIEEEFWRPLESASRVEVESIGGPGEHGTNLEAALEGALSRHRNLKAALLVTDGDWNTGDSPAGPATRYRSLEIPVFSVVVGRESPLPDLILEEVDAPSYGLFGEQISLPFRIRSHMPRDIETTVTLQTPDGEVARKDLMIPAAGEIRDTLLWYPTEVGDIDLTMSFPVAEGESLPGNNEASFRINVRVEKLKVLVVDSRPRWEYRYLRNALERDPGVDMHCLLLHPRIGVGGGRHSLPAFPGTREQISRYDVIFLGDVGVGEHELTEEDAELIAGLVEQQ